jgi:hypothetical protein
MRPAAVLGVLGVLGTACAGAPEAPPKRLLETPPQPAPVASAEATPLPAAAAEPTVAPAGEPARPPRLAPLEPVRLLPAARLELDFSVKLAVPALFTSGDSSAALSCNDSRAPQQPADPAFVRCVFEPTAVLELGGVITWAAVATDASEHDGMYTIREHLILAVPHSRGVEVIHTLTQWDQAVYDCGTSLVQRRHAVRDLDAEAGAEICIESIHEEGPGLGTVSDLFGKPKGWLPEARRRWVQAFRLDVDDLVLVRAPELDARCPPKGYSPFVPRPLGPDAVARRRLVQGETQTPRCPKALMDSCFDMEGCRKPEP